MEWTTRQKEAIETKNKNILVSASAGSGKTAVLSERIVQLSLSEKVNIDKFVVVTFTRLAANEMKTRIAKRFEKARETYDDEEFLDEQMILIEKANISTLDSFNVSLLRDYFYMIDIEPNFGIMEQVDNEILKGETLEKLFAKYYETSDKEFITLLAMYSNFKNDNGLKDEINFLYNYAVSMPMPKAALEDLKGIYNLKTNVEDTKYYDFFKTHISRMVKETRDELDEYKEYSDIIANEAAKLTEILEAFEISYDELRNRVNSLEFATLRLPKDTPDEVKETIKKSRDDEKKLVKELKERYLNVDSKELAAEMATMRPYVEKLIDLAKEFMDNLFAEKKKLNRYDFNDLAHLAIELLTDEKGNPSKLACDLKETYKYIIVDEYQDVNEIQETILRAISKDTLEESNMFMVGDVKQSIYRFRKADPEIFTQKYNDYKENKDPRNVKIDLNQNFRSRSEVLDSINFLFEKLMIKEVGNIEYDDDMALKYGNGYSTELDYNYKTELDLICEDEIRENLKESLKENIKDIKENENENENEKEEDNNDLSEDDKLTSLIKGIKREEIEAKYIADKIKDMISNKYQIFDIKENKYKDIAYKDMTVLLRSFGTIAFTYYKILKENDIPAVMSKQENFITEIEVQLMLAILKIIDNPYDDVSLVTVLYSETFDFKPEELMILKKRNRYQTSFFTILENEYKEIKGITTANDSEEKNAEKEQEQKKKQNQKYKLEEDLKLKIIKAMETYKHLKDYSLQSSLEDLIREIYSSCNEEKYFLGLYNMKNKISNINLLLEFAKKFEQTGSRNIYDFIKCTDQIIEMKSDLPYKSEVETGDAVNIMTIHKSKGLEYNVVFMPSLDKKLNKRELYSKTLVDKKLGYVTKYINVEKVYQKTNFYYEIIKEKIKVENLAEEMRVLYVALTRAKEKLILVSTMSEPDKYMDQIKDNKLKYKYILSIDKYLDFYMPQVLENKSKDYFEVNYIKDVDLKMDDIANESSLVKELFNEIEKEDKSSEKNEKHDEFVYPYEALKTIKQKVSVTELKKLKMHEETEDENFDFNLIDNLKSEDEVKENFKADVIRKIQRKDKTKLTGAEKGTITHKLMKILNDTSVKDEFEKLIENGIFKREELDQIDKEKIETYLNSDLFKRIKSSNFVKREMPFMMKKDASEVYKQILKDDKSDKENENENESENENKTTQREKLEKDDVIIQGIIDCIFEEDGKIVILDYKTDKVYKSDISKEDRIKELVKNYKVQLDLYEEAVKQIYNKEIKEKILYLFDCGEVVEIK